MVVKDRVHADGKLIENTHDFFAQDDRGTVHYLGERVENIHNGHVRNHSGSWLFGRDTNKLGVLMPAKPRKGDRWMSEDAPPITVEHDKMIKRIPRYVVHGHGTGTRSRCASTRSPTRRSSTRSTPRASA